MSRDFEFDSREYDSSFDLYNENINQLARFIVPYL